MISDYLTFFIAFQVMCLVFAFLGTVINTVKLRGTQWFLVYGIYGITIGVMTARRIQVLAEGRPSATALDTMVVQTIIAVGFLVCTSMAFSILHKKNDNS